jgi:hypothetical protein
MTAFVTVFSQLFGKGGCCELPPVLMVSDLSLDCEFVR